MGHQMPLTASKYRLTHSGQNPLHSNFEAAWGTSINTVMKPQFNSFTVRVTLFVLALSPDFVVCYSIRKIATSLSLRPTIQGCSKFSFHCDTNPPRHSLIGFISMKTESCSKNCKYQNVCHCLQVFICISCIPSEALEPELFCTKYNT